VSVLLVGCAGSTGSTRYRVWSSGRQTVFVGPKVTVIRSARRVTSWTERGTEILWDPAKRCYRRTTRFNRADIRELRNAAPPVTAGSGDDRGGQDVKIRPDEAGRPAVTWERSGRWFAIPAGHWRRTTYTYPGRADFEASLPRRPTASCR